MLGPLLAFRCDGIDQVERGVDSVVSLLPVRDGEPVTPTSATVTIRDARGELVVDAGIATCADGAATYTVAAAATADRAPESGWSIVWSVVLPGETIARAPRFRGVLVLRRLYPVVAEQDLYDRCTGLDPDGPAPLTTRSTFTPFLRTAWSTICRLLVQLDRRPWLVSSPDALHEVHLTLTLARIFEDEATRQNDLASTAARYQGEFRDAWAAARLAFTYAEDADQPSTPAEAPAPAVFLGGSFGD